MDDGRNAGPAAMAQTSIGTIFLYDLGDDDIFAYAQRSGEAAPQRIRRLLERVGSKFSFDAGGSPPPLGADEVAALTAPEIELLFEIYVGSPKLQWYQTKSLEAGNPIVRGGAESATAYFDRLIDWYAGYRRAGAAAAPLPVDREDADAAHDLLAQFAERIQASQQSIDTSLRWAAGALIVALAVLGAGASWLAYQSHLRAVESDRRTEAWQQQMKMFAENNTALERGFTELAAENARLKARIAALESRGAGAAPKAAAPPPPAPPRSTPARTRPPAKK